MKHTFAATLFTMSLLSGATHGEGLGLDPSDTIVSKRGVMACRYEEDFHTYIQESWEGGDAHHDALRHNCVIIGRALP
jgi:hypothetical protein